MPSKMVTAAAVALGLVCPASAETRISVGGSASEESTTRLVQLGRVTNGAVKRVALNGTTLAFDVTTTSSRPTEVIAMLDVARGAQVTAMNVTVGGRALYTQAQDPARARSSYFGTVRGNDDPALLERVGATETGTELQLRVFPLSKAVSAHVEITVEVPPEGEGFDLKAPAFVSGDTSLVALDNPQRSVPIVFLCGGGHAWRYGDLDKSIIRRYVKLNMPRVKACYERELLRAPTLAGKVELHFSIATTGKLTDVSVDGDLPSEVVKRCIADDLAQWEFPSVQGSSYVTRVNYPLTLVPSGS